MTTQKRSYRRRLRSVNTFTETLSDLDKFKQEAISKLYQGQPLTGKKGVFTDMIKDILETALSEELNQHLSQEQEDDPRVVNRKNGYNSKTVKSKESAFTLNTPRERNSSFEPQIVKKGQTLKHNIFLYINHCNLSQMVQIYYFY